MLLNSSCCTHRARLGCALTVLFVSMGSSAVVADSWNTRADISTGWLYNDNPTLLPDNSPIKRQATSFGQLQARGVLEYATPQFEMDIAPRVSRLYYPKPEDSDLNTTDFYFISSAGYNLQRSNLNLTLDYSNVGLLTDEFGDGIDNNPGTGAGGSSLRVDDRVQRYNANPQWNYQLTNKDRVTVGLRYFGTDFKLTKTNRADNSNVEGRLGYNRSITPRISFGLSGFARQFESNKLAPIPIINLELTNTSESYGLTFDANYAFSEQTTMGISIGRTEVASTRDAFLLNPLNIPFVATTESTSSNTIFNFTLNHITERNDFSLLLSQGIVPNSQGFEANQLSLFLVARRRLSEKFSGTLQINTFRQEAVNTLQLFKSTFLLFSTTGILSYDLSRNWLASGVYTYRAIDNDFSSTSQKGDSNQIGVTFTYRWD